MRTDVGQQQEFDELAEHADPPPKQEIVNPDLLIEIPPPAIDESLVLAPAIVEPTPGPASNWPELLDALDFDERDVDSQAVQRKRMAAERWCERRGMAYSIETIA